MDRAYFPYFLDPKANIFIVESSLPNNNDKKKHTSVKLSESLKANLPTLEL